MIIKEKTTDVIPVTTEDTGVNAALAIVLVFALIAVIGIYAYVVNNGSSTSSAPQMPTLIERNNTQTVTPVPVPTPIPTPVPVQTPAPAAPAPAPDASSSDSGSAQ